MNKSAHDLSSAALRLAIAFLALALAAPVAAQLRFATGMVEGDWNEFEPINPPLTTTITTTGMRVCGPAQPLCAGQSYPGFAPNQSMVPVRPTGALLSGGTAQGAAVQMPFADEWALTTMGTVPSGAIPGVISIMTFFEGRNEAALAATGKGWSAGGGPGNLIFNPAPAGLPTAMYTTRTFAAATSPVGSTTSSGVVVTRTFPSMPAQPNAILRMQTTAGPRQFGGSAALLTDSPNRLTLQFPTAQFVRTNGRCAPSTPFGECHSGFYVGTDRVQTSARIYQHSVAPVKITQHWRWYGLPWTTGTASAAGRLPNAETSLGRTGTDVGGSSRHLVMVTPILSYGTQLDGGPGSTAQVWTWDITFAPEPVAGVGLALSVVLLGLLYRRR